MPLKKVLLLIFLNLCLVSIIANPPLHAQENGVWSIKILESDGQHLLVELRLPDFAVETIRRDNITYQRLSVADSWSRWGQPGQPLLPQYNLLVGLPAPGTPQVTVVAADTETLSDYTLYPNPAYTTSGTATQPKVVETFAFDAETYRRNATLPGRLVEAAEPGFLREQPLFQLRLFPFQYNPVQKRLTVARRLRVMVTFPEASLSLQQSGAESNPEFRRMLEQVLVNYADLPQSVAPLDLPAATPEVEAQDLDSNAEYVIITHPNFYNAVQALATYRASQGLRVAVVKSTDIYAQYNAGVKSPEAIRAYLANAYATWQIKPVYVLLVGDSDVDAARLVPDPANPGQQIVQYNPNVATDFLPSYYQKLLVFSDFTGYPAPLDTWFGQVHGDDVYPDLIVGRLPARSITDVNTVIEKVQTYEQTPVVGDWVRSAVLVADDDEGFDSDMEAVADFLPSNITPIKLYEYDPQQTVESAIDSGNLFIAYSGHGGETDWGGWSNDRVDIYNKNRIANMSNGYKLPFLTVANCDNGFFSSTATNRVFAEEFLLIPNKGGIAAWAPAGFSFPTVNTLMTVEFYRALFEQGDLTLGSVATTAWIQAYTQNSYLDRTLFQIFTFFGDPAVRLDLPPILSLSGQVTTDLVTAGQPVTYTLSYQIKNNRARDLTLLNTLPAGVTFQSASMPPDVASDQQLTWYLGHVPAGSYSLTLTGWVSGDAGLVEGQALLNAVQLTDSAGGSQQTLLTTTFSTGEVLPVANFLSSSPTQLGQPTYFSNLSTGGNLSHLWHFGDGSTSTTTSPVHTYASSGEYIVELTVTNTRGSDTTQQVLLITEASSPPPETSIHLPVIVR